MGADETARLRAEPSAEQLYDIHSLVRLMARGRPHLRTIVDRHLSVFRRDHLVGPEVLGEEAIDDVGRRHGEQRPEQRLARGDPFKGRRSSRGSPLGQNLTLTVPRALIGAPVVMLLSLCAVGK